MPVTRIHKTNNYTVMSNFHFQEKTMSLKAKGLLSLMLSLPEGWDYSIMGLVTLSSDGETAVRSALKELETFKYLVRTPIRENGKIIDWNYDIYEKPLVENQVVDNKDNKITKQANTGKVSKDKSLDTINFLGSGKKQKPKSSLYSKASSLINGFTDDSILKENLFAFLDLQLEIYRDKGKTYYINTFKNRLNNLKKNFKQEEWADVVTQSVKCGWQDFYPLKRSKSKISDIEKLEVVHIDSADFEEIERQAKEREKRGQRVSF